MQCSRLRLDATTGRYYVVKLTSESYALEETVDSDYGTLKDGTLVLDAQHTNKVHGLPWYTPNPHTFVCPAEQLLHASFPMQPATRPQRATKAHKKALEQAAVVLAQEDIDITMAELKGR